MGSLNTKQSNKTKHQYILCDKRDLFQAMVTFHIGVLTSCRLNGLPHTTYRKILISIFRYVRLCDLDRGKMVELFENRGDLDQTQRFLHFSCDAAELPECCVL